MKQKAANQYKPRALKWFNILLRYTLGIFLQLYFRVSTSGLEEVKKLKSYVLIPTHHGNWDPFIIGSLLPKSVHWVTSDGNMRSRFMRFVLQFVGSIPKSKNIPDIQTISMIVDTIRKKKGIVGLFVEGQASWDGHTQKIMDGTGKLIKLLKVPVVLAIFHGAYYSQPRWGRKIRRGKLHIDFKVLFDSDEIKTLDHQKLQEKLAQGMEYDEATWQKNSGQTFASIHRAEFLERALYLCPFCKSIASLQSNKNRIHCSLCDFATVLNSEYRFFPREIQEKNNHIQKFVKPFETIREWNLWQKNEYPIVLKNLISEKNEKTIFFDENTKLFQGRRMDPLILLGRGRLKLFSDRIEHEGKNKTHSFYFKDIDAEGVLKSQLFEFYEGKNLYQIRFKNKSASARKWADAITALR